MKQSLQRQTVAERPKLSCTRDTFQVLGHTGAVIVVYILFHKVTKYILYRFKVTRSLNFTSNLQYSPLHKVTKYILYRFKVTRSLNFASNLQYSPLPPTGGTALRFLYEVISEHVLFLTRCWFDTNVMQVRLLGENTDNAVAPFVLLKNRLILYKIEISGYCYFV